MESMLEIIIVIAVIVGIIAGLHKPVKKKNQNFLYKSKTYFFTKTEAAFYRSLVDAVSDKYIIFSKVRLADLIEPNYNQNNKIYYSAFNQISRKHVDFILVDKNNLKISSAIELDGKSHFRSSTKKSDEIKNNAFKKAGLTLIRFRVKDSFDPDEIIERLNSELLLREMKNA